MTPPVRVCIVYDCLFPWTVGGAERWYRSLAVALAEAGCHVTYLTRLQWEPDDPPDLPGVHVVAVSGKGELYDTDGQRRLKPPLEFGWGVLRHLVGRRSNYDVVHTCGFPYFPILAIRLALLGRRGRPVVFGEWVEVWSAGYWRTYLGRWRGMVGLAVQRLCIRLTPHALSHSRLHGARLRRAGYRGPDPVVIEGLFTIGDTPERPEPREPVVVFAGRHIEDKRPEVIPAAVSAARRAVPGLTAMILGDGPRRPAVLQAIADAGAESFVTAPGFVSAVELETALSNAAVHLLPSRREGHGMVVVEAAAAGTPSVVVSGEDNAATELITDGINGTIVPNCSPESIAAGIVRVVMGGQGMRATTAKWFDQHRTELDVRTSCALVLDLYRARLR